jgi:glycosyltransferase involved in cell wall biosynthesis
LRLATETHEAVPKRRILIITNGQLSRNPRPLKEAQTLGAAGFDVTVLMVRNHAAGERHDVMLMRDAPFRRECLDLVPGFGTGAARVFVRRAQLSVARRIRRQSIHSLGPAQALLARARTLPSDLTIVHNEVPHWVGLRLSDEQRPIAADIEDWHSEDLLPADRAHRPLEVLRENERALLQRAAYTTTTSQALATALHARYGGRVPAVISNSFPLQPVPSRNDAADTPPTFFWFSQTLGPGRGLEAFVEAWSETRRPSRLVLLGEAREAFRADLLARLPPDRRPHISFLALVPPPDLPALIARHDIGLALEEADIPNRNLTITNKILQYLNAGLAIVASDTAGQREVLGHGPDAGVLLRTAGRPAVTATLDALLADRGALRRRQTAARRLAETRYCWEREAPRLLALVEAALR